MKKVLIAVAAIALFAWVISWFRVPEAVATSAAKPWPGGMGPLESAGDRFPPQKGNEASRKLAALGAALPKNEAVDAFVQREIARGELAIGGAPAVPDVSAIRELLLHEPVAWDRYGTFDDPAVGEMRVLQMTMARALVASALAKARAGDGAAWDDLHAVWKLARSLDGHPQMMVQTAALGMGRMINGVAWKMPLPAPEWVAELRERDHVRPLIEAFQYMAASYAGDGSNLFPTKLLANSVDKDRGIAEQLLKVTQCGDPNVPMNDLGPDLRLIWRRMLRYRAEREATANALRLRENQPIETKSVCSDGTWSFDGTAVRFSKEIPLEDAMPLVLRVKADAAR